DTPAEVPPPKTEEAANAENAPAAVAGAAAGNAPAVPSSPARPGAIQSEATPLVVNGVMYLASAYNRIVALDADTGKEIWVKNIGHQPSTRGLAYWPGMSGYAPRLVFGTSDSAALMMELDAKTGEFVSGFGTGGMVDLRKGVGEKFPKL